MKSQQEIKKVFGPNFNRNLKIFMAWVSGDSVAIIAKDIGLAKASVTKNIHAGAKAAIFANELTYRDMPQDISCKGYRDNAERYIELTQKALDLNVSSDLSDTEKPSNYWRDVKAL